MKFTDLFIRRPVLAGSISLMILLLGARAWTGMTIRQFPHLTSTVITVSTFYPGAAPDVVQAFITAPLQQAVGGAPGIDYMTATSEPGKSTIIANMRLDFDPDTALTQIMGKVNQAQNLLPAEAQRPTVQETVGGGTALMWLSFRGTNMTQQQVNDYVLRVARPKIEGVDGVGRVQISPAGMDPTGNAYALRAWLDPARMAARGVTATDVANALTANNLVSAAGRTRNSKEQVTIVASTSLNDVRQFRNLIVRNVGTTQIRLGDVADVDLGTQNYNQMAFFNGEHSVFLGIEPTPEANDLSVTNGVHEVVRELQKALPPGIRLDVAYDQSVFINASLKEVLMTIGVTLAVVVVVIFLFLGALRSMLLPAVAIPLSVVGAGTLMLALGFSINLLTLLAVVLAIGLVVDDAIIVLENIQRLIDEGESPVDAAIHGARELATPIIVMSTTLVAVYVPIGFMGGLTGSLFTEFAFTLVATVVVSMIVALTLTPMLCSRILRRTPTTGLMHRLDHGFSRLRAAYDRSLETVLGSRGPVVLAGAGILVAIPFLFLGTSSELAPTEDQGTIFVSGTGPATATLEYLNKYNKEIQKIVARYPETALMWQNSGLAPAGGAGSNAVFGGANLRDWSERKRTQMQIAPLMQRDLDAVTGLEIVTFSRPSLPGSAGGLPIQFVLTSNQDFRQMDAASGQLIGAAMQTGKFAFLTKNLRYDAPAISLQIKRDVASDLGLDMRDIGSNLSALLSESFVGRFNLAGRSYQVIPQVPDRLRGDIGALDNYYLRTTSGKLVPLTTVVDVKRTVQPEFLPEFQQLNAVTVQGVMAPGTTLGEALAELGKVAASTLPAGYAIDYASESRQFMQQGNTLVITFALSILLVYLLLAAQFESFRDPFIVLVAVPMSVFGALAFLYSGAATLNIYTEIGLITLIGLITKQSILVVQFANEIRANEGLGIVEAIRKASSIRLRPILMTTAAMVLGVVPLLLATGPGAVSRFHLGLVIATGLTIGALISLYVVPVVYTFLAHRGSVAHTP